MGMSPHNTLALLVMCFTGEICRSRKVFFHTDAAQVIASIAAHYCTPSLSLSLCVSLQAVGKVPVDVNDMTVDLMSISGHKLYGPKGVGALYVRRKPRVRLDPIMSGGGQER